MAEVTGEQISNVIRWHLVGLKLCFHLLHVLQLLILLKFPEQIILHTSFNIPLKMHSIQMRLNKKNYCTWKIDHTFDKEQYMISKQTDKTRKISHLSEEKDQPDNISRDLRTARIQIQSFNA